MRIIRPGAIAAAGIILLIASLVPSSVLAGTPDVPEITDPSGDSKSGKQSRDIIGVWFDGETDTQLNMTMNLTVLDSFTGISDLQNLPTTEYEVYFRCKDKNYAAACKVPVHGPAGLTIQGELRSVTYGNSTDETTETTLSTITPIYTVAAHTIKLTVSKTDIGDPPAASHLSNTWAAVWNKNWGEANRSIEDRAPNAGYGRDYIIRGAAGAEILKVELTAESSTQTGSLNEPAHFKLSLFNNGTSTVNVHLMNATPSKGWTCDFQTLNLTIGQNASKVAYLDIQPARDSKNGTREYTMVWATVSTGNQNATTDKITLTTVVSFIPPAAGPEKNFFDKFLQWIKDNPKTAPIFIGAPIAAVVGIAIAGYAYSKLKRRDEYEDELPPSPAPRPAK
jgi:hypothetical protein